MSNLRSRARTARRDLRQTQRDERKELRDKNKQDRKDTRKAVKTVKEESRNKRKDRVNDAGENVRMSRSDRRADRKATRKAGRNVKKDARKARRKIIKDDRTENKAQRQGLRDGQKAARDIMKGIDEKAKNAAVTKKADSMKHEKAIITTPKPSSNTKPLNTKEQNEADAAYYQSDADKAKNSDANRKDAKSKSLVNDDMTFGKAYRTQRDANKASKTSHTDKKGNFTWKGKSYNTESKSEKTARTKKKAGGILSTKGATPVIGKPIKKGHGGKKKMYESGGFLEPGIETLFEN